MGLGRSRVRRMDGRNESGGDGGESSSRSEPDLATMLSYLIRRLEKKLRRRPPCFCTII